MSDLQTLRRKAEAVFGERVQNPVPIRTEAEILQLVQELELQKIMLEMVNEDLFVQNDEKGKRAIELIVANNLSSILHDRLNEIASLIPSGVFQFLLRPDGSSCFPYASEAINHLFRVTPEEVRDDAKAAFKNIHPDDYEGVLASIMISATELTPWQHEYRVRFEDGTIQTLLANTIPKRLPDGSILWHGITTDISSLKLSEMAFKQSEESFRNVVEHSPMPSVVHRNGTIVYSNPALLRMMGVEKVEDMTGTNILDWIHPDFQETVKLRTRKVIEEGISTPMAEIQFIRFDETVGDAEAQSTPITYGGLPSVHIALNDITERKQAEVALLAANKSLSDILNAATNTSIISTDIKGLITLFSKGAENMLGYSADEIVGKVTPARFHLESEAIKRGMELTQEFGRPITGFEVFSANAQIHENEARTWTYIHKNGTRIIVNLIITAIRNTNKELIGFLGIASNITKRKEAEEALLDSSKKWEAIVSASPDGIGIVSFDGKLEFMSDQLAKMYGYSVEHKEEYFEKSIFEFIDPSSHQLLTNNFHALLGGNKDFEITEYLAVKKDNSRFNLEVKSAVLLDRNGKPENILFIDRDITERKKIEAELEESREKYRGLSEASFEAIFISEKGVCIEQNQAAELMFGYTSEEAMNRPGTEWIVPEDREMVMNNMISGYEAQYEAMALRKDGTSFPCVVNGRMMNYKGRDVRVTSLADISTLKKAEDEVNRVSTRLAMATRAGGVGVWDYDLVNNILLWDDQMYLLYNANKNEFSGAYDAWSSRVHPDDKADSDEAIQRAIRGEQEFNTEYRVIWSDGSVHTIRALASFQYDLSGHPIRMIGTNWDITEQKRIEAVLSKATIDAEAANKSKSIFLANMSHEIRTPLNAIIGFSQLMNREKLTDAQKEYVVSIHRSGEHLLKLINDILELSKMEAGRVALNPTNVDLQSLFADIHRMFALQAQAKQLQLIFERSADLPQYVIVDDNKLRQILINLIGNAIKFTDQGGVVVRARVDPKEDSGSILVVEIQDSGTGISESELSKLFRHFEQASAGIKQRSGTGLGLALSRELAILMGGNITVTSELNTGSVFRFQVEIREGKAEINPLKINKRVIAIDNAIFAYRILVVDDLKENLKVVVDFLRMPGLETNVAVNGEDAIVKFEQWDPHLILMDLRMPVMDGYEAIRRIKATSKGEKTPIIVLSASQFEEEKVSEISLNIQGYIRKPFRENELFESIGKVLGIDYIYEEDVTVAAVSDYLNTPEAVAADLAKLPQRLISQMRDALEGGDFYGLIELIKAIEPGNPEMARHLRFFANTFDYDYLHQIIK